MLHPGQAVGNLGKVVLSQLLHPVEVEGAVVGAQGVDVPPLQSLPQGLLVFQGPGGRGKDVLGRLKAGQAVAALVQQKILGAGLQIDLLPPLTGGQRVLQPPPGGQVDHVHRIPRALGDGQPAVHRLGLHRRGAGPGMGGGAQASGCLLRPDARVDQVAVFTVAAQHAPFPAHRLDHLVGCGVAQAQVVIGQIDLVGGHPRGGHVPELGADAGVPVLDGHVEAVVTAGFSVRPAVPGLQRGGQRAAPLRLGKVQHGGGAPRQSGPGAGEPVVRRLVGQALVHLEVGVGVDQAGKHQLPGGVQHPAVPRGQGGAELDDLVPVHPQIGPLRAVRQDQDAVLNQNRHRGLLYTR